MSSHPGHSSMDPEERNAVSFPNAVARYGMPESTAAFCLGHPSHPVQPEEVICRICGTLVAGAQLGIYQVQQLLGSGRSGKAYLATHLRSKQPVVIKLFAPDPASSMLWEAARHEVRITTALRHSSLLPIFSCTTWQCQTQPGTTRPLHELMSSFSGPETYLLTLCQYAPATLGQFVLHYEKNRAATHEQRNALLSRLLHLIQQAGEALSAVHTRSIAHGALVPGNFLLDGQEHLWIADVGLARLHPPPAPYLAPELYNAGTMSMRAGNMTAFWEAVEPASDQYTLATLCQQLFTRLLRPADYEHALPVLQCATNQKPARRFASIDIFVHELLTQMTPGHDFPAEARHTSGPLRLTPPPDQQRTTEQRRGYAQLTAAQREQYDRAVHYNLASSLPSPTPADDWEKLGGKLFTAHDYEGAVKAYRRAMELDAGKPALWLALGDTYFALEHYGEALRTYEQAMALNPNDPQVWTNRGTVLDALGRHKEAIECYERADQLSS